MRHSAIAALHYAFGLWPMGVPLVPVSGACRCGAGQQFENTVGYLVNAFIQNHRGFVRSAASYRAMCNALGIDHAMAASLRPYH